MLAGADAAVKRHHYGAVVAALRQCTRQSGDDVSLLRERVTSKGGTTEAALRVLGDEQLAERFRKAVEAARRRSMELGATLGKDA